MDELAIRRARKQLAQGLDCVEEGQYAKALQLFRDSARNHATAEALTYWGWMEHHFGQIERAIGLCEQAIEVDPDLGNPYNDIGSYLIEQGKLDEAIEWLEKALRASRYEPRQFPHINLARIYMAKGLPLRALQHFKSALEFDPQNPDILKAVEGVLASLDEGSR